MRNKDYRYRTNGRDFHPQVGIGIFFIVLGAALLVASNDLLHLGSFRSYFTWQTVLIFIGVVLLFNLKFTGGVLLIAAGTWFLLDDIYIEMPQVVKTIYWPAVIVLIGLSFIMSSLVQRNRNKNINKNN